MFFATLTSIMAFFIIFSAGFFSIAFELKSLSIKLNNIAAEAAKEPLGKLPTSADKPQGERSREKAVQFDLQSSCAAVAEATSSQILFAKEADKEWPIASITKLATALVFLESNPGWDAVYTITDEDRREGGRINVFRGEKIKVKDLFNLSLVGSDNTATIALVHSTGLSEEDFVKKMNAKAENIGLKRTRFYDAVGLSNNNVSIAREVIELARVSLAKEEIRTATLKKKYEFLTTQGRKKTVYNTDGLLDNFPQNGIKILGGKTGYTESAGYCFVGKFADQSGREIISVVLGSPNNDSRFSQTKDLVEWVYKNFVW
jgi:D-alanyl-D-alanine carboxypeptidase